MAKNKYIVIFFLMFVPLSLAGCFNLQQLDKAVVEKNNQLAESARDNFADDIDKARAELKQKARDKAYEVADRTFRFVAESLTNEAKRRIDDWLVEHNLNEYGDSKDTVYTGGTPLFKEDKNEYRDKYEYILQQHPELVEELGL